MSKLNLTLVHSAPRLLVMSPLIAAGAVATIAVAPAVTTGVAVAAALQALASVAGNIAATDIHQFLTDRVLSDDVLQSKDLVRAITDAIGLVIRKTAKEVSGKQQREAVEQLASLDVSVWLDVQSMISASKTLENISIKEVLQIFSTSTEEFAKFKVLEINDWRDIVCGLAAVNSLAVEGDIFSLGSGVVLSRLTIDLLAQRLYTMFPRALFEVLKADFAKEGKAYGELLIRLVSNISSTPLKTRQAAYELLNRTGQLITNTETTLEIVERTESKVDQLLDLTQTLKQTPSRKVPPDTKILSFDWYRSRIISHFEDASPSGFLNSDVNLPALLKIHSELTDEDGMPVFNKLKTACLSGNKDSVLLLGDYGTGKTTLCLRLTYSLLKETTITCLYIELKFSKGRLKTYVIDKIAEFLNTSNITLQDLQAYAEQHSTVLILDGFDEMFWKEKNENVIAGAVADVLTLSSICPVILSSRSHFFLSLKQAESYFEKRFTISRLMPLDEGQIHEILSDNKRQDLISSIKANRALQDLASRPIHLRMILETPGGVHSSREADIYERYVQNCLARDRGRRSIFTQDQTLKVMQDIGLFLLNNNRTDLSVADAAAIITKHAHNSKLNEQDIVTDILSNSFLIHSPTEGYFQFSHKSFLDFFIAQALVSIIRNKELIEAMVDNLYYMLEVLLFIRDLLRAEDIPLMMESIKTTGGKRRPLLIMLARQLIESDSAFRDMLRELLFDHPYLEAASKVEIIYAIYRFSTDAEKSKLADILWHSEREYTTTAKTQFQTSNDLLSWARRRISNPLYTEGREFLYLFPLALVGDGTDVSIIKTFQSHESELVRRQAVESLKRLERGQKGEW